MTSFAQRAFAVLALSCAPGVATACDQWSIAGPFTIIQSNRLTVTGDFVQNGATLSGAATFFSPTLGDGGTQVDGKISGAIDGSSVRFDVTWYGSFVTCDGECVGGSYDDGGAYEGSIAANGEVSGFNWRIADPNNKVTWRMAAPAQCAPPPPKKVVSLGKKKAPPPKPYSPSVSDIARAPELGEARDAKRCKPGFVWREAKAEDFVCVPPESRDRTATENENAESRRDPTGAYGPYTCISGYVWREAFDGDVVCVTPETRAVVKQENDLAPSRTEE